MNVYKVIYTKIAAATNRTPRGTGVDGVANAIGKTPSDAGDRVIAALGSSEIEINVSGVHELAKDVIGV